MMISKMTLMEILPAHGTQARSILDSSVTLYIERDQRRTDGRKISNELFVGGKGEPADETVLHFMEDALVMEIFFTQESGIRHDRVWVIPYKEIVGVKFDIPAPTPVTV